jgi:uncharacterized DUF497 family protein
VPSRRELSFASSLPVARTGFLKTVLVLRGYRNDKALEWDDAKATENWRRQGVRFQQGAKALRDPFAVEWIDDRVDYGEERINLLGMCEGVILHAVRSSRCWPTAASDLSPIHRCAR